jgi:hypothetical protein
MARARTWILASCLLAAGLSAAAPACLFSPQPCEDLLVCGGGGATATVSTTAGTGTGGRMSTATSSATATSSSTGAGACTKDGQCKDANPCTNDACVAGHCENKADDTLIPDDNNPCTTDACSGGNALHVPAMAGKPCMGTLVCDMMGKCDGCTLSIDCTTGTKPSCDMATHTCISCSDGKQNGNETGVDCGGVCLKCPMAVCASDGECASGFCADGLCCDAACNDVCKACNLAGSVGTCTPLPVGLADNDTCPGPLTTCDGVGGPGSCKKAIGQACLMAAECADGVCVAGFCRIATGGACTDEAACGSFLCKAGVCADCALDADCSSMSCVAPVCKAKTGEPCGADSDCIGGTCTSGLCKLPLGAACAIGAECHTSVCKNFVCAQCAGAGDCMALGTSCAQGQGGTCRLPTGAYCAPGNPCQLGPCTGFPAKCQ